VLSNSSGNAIHSSTNITVNSGGTLVLRASNQIGDGVGLILNGGTLLVGYDTVSDTIGDQQRATFDEAGSRTEGLRRGLGDLCRDRLAGTEAIGRFLGNAGRKGTGDGRPGTGLRFRPPQWRVSGDIFWDILVSFWADGWAI